MFLIAELKRKMRNINFNNYIMKKKLLLMSLLVTSLGASAQFNWLSNGDFEATDKTLERSTSNATPAKGDWAIYAQNGQDTFVGTLKQETNYGKVAEITGSSSVSWYKAYLMQNVQYPLKAEKYQLVFDAKNVSGNTNISAWIYLDNGNTYALKTDFDDKGGESKASGARYDFVGTAEWRTFTADFDFAWQCNNINAPSSTWEKTVTAAADLANARVAFGTNAKAGTFLIDNIKLVPVNPNTKPDDVDPEPEPDPEPTVPADPAFPDYVTVTDEGDFLKDGGFDLDVDTIQTWRTLDKGKYLGDTGHWYFYNEDKTGVDPYASIAKIQDSGDSHGKVVALINKKPINSWWGHDLLQRVGVKLQPMTYRLSFYIRSNSGATGKVNIALKEKDAVKCSGYALLDGFVPAEHPKSSGTTPNFKATTEWQLMEYVFDLSKMATTIWSPTSGTTPETEAEAIANYIQTIANEELWENAYLCIWNETASSTLEIDDVILEPIDTYTSIQNPSFETNTLLPIMIGDNPAPGVRSGQWVVVNKREGVMNLSVDGESAFDGQRSMKLETVNAARYPRLDQYMAMDIYEVPEGNYTFNFAAKASQKDAPIRVDIYVYSDSENFKAVTGENGDNYELDTDASHGLKVFNATTDWVEYSQPVVIPENMLVRLIIRPNIKGTNNTGLPSDYALPVSHWFDNFSFNEVQGPNNINAGANDEKVQVNVLNGLVQVAGLENANVAIYSVNGSLIDQIDNVNGTVAHSLAQGLYIVKVVSATTTHTVKVLVK